MTMHTFKSSLKIAGLLITCVIGILSIIATGGGGSSNNTINPKPTTSTNISGIASKGPISGGTVYAYAINPDGTKGEQKGTSTTNTAGTYSIDLGSYTGDVIIEVTGGTYTDEATNSTKTNSLMRAALTNVSGDITAQVTPLTEMAVQIASTSTGINASKIDAANALVSNLIGTDILTTPPADVLNSSASTPTLESQAYGLMLASISEMENNGYDAVSLIADDLKTDNQLDVSSTTQYLSNGLSDFVDSNLNDDYKPDSTSVIQLAQSFETFTVTPIPDTVFTMSDLAGTWNSVRLASPASDASGYHHSGAENISIQTDGAFTVTCMDTSEPPCDSPTSGTGISISIIGAVTPPPSPDVTEYNYMSLGKNLVAGLSVYDNNTTQSISLAAKRASSYSQVDLQGTWIGMGLRSPAGSGSANNHGYNIQHSVIQSDGTGIQSCIASSEGCGPDVSLSDLTVSNNGLLSVPGVPADQAADIALSADKNVAVELDRSPDNYQIFLSVKQAANYSMADLAGTWMQVLFQSPTMNTLVDSTIVGGHGASIGKAVIAADGSYTFTCVYADYGCNTPVETGPPGSIAIAADGTISGSDSSPTKEYWAMSAGKDVIVTMSLNASNETQALTVLVKTGK